MFDGSVMRSGEGFFSLPGGGNRVAVRGGVKNRRWPVACAWKMSKPPFAAGRVVYPADELPERAVAKSLCHNRHLGHSHWATGPCLTGRARVRARC